MASRLIQVQRVAPGINDASRYWGGSLKGGPVGHRQGR